MHHFPSRALAINGILVLILIVGAVIVYVTLRGRAGASADSNNAANLRLTVVRTFAGSGSTQTTPFMIASDGSWRVAWTCTPSAAVSGSQSAFAIKVHSTSAAAADFTLVSSTCVSGGKFVHTSAGSYELTVTSGANWKITVSDYQ